jgi:hypothetical protein
MAVTAAVSESACTTTNTLRQHRAPPSADKLDAYRLEALLVTFKLAARHAACVERDLWRERLRAQKMDMQRAPPAALAAQQERVAACEARVARVRATLDDTRTELERMLEALMAALRGGACDRLT